MEDKALISYKLFIKECDTNNCAEFSPFGICYIDDCLACPKTRVKIIREDGAVMRDDFKAKKNTMIDDKLWSFKRMIERDGIEIFEKMYNVKFTKFQKWYLGTLFKIKSIKKNIKEKLH